MGTSTNCYKRLKCILKVSGALNVIFLIVIVVIIVIQQYKTKDLPQTLPATQQLGAPGRVCIPCCFRGADITDTLYERILTTESNTTFCCYHKDADLQRLIFQLETENRYNADNNNLPENLRWWKQRNFAAHLYAVHDSAFDRPPLWTERHHTTAFCRNLTLKRDRRLKVPASGVGMYFVYSLFTFDFGNMVQEKNIPLGSHTIYRYKQTYLQEKKEMLWTSKVGGQNTPSRQTSFLCGVVMLDRGEEIESEAFTYLNMKHSAEHIGRSLFSNYFGMFKLHDTI